MNYISYRVSLYKLNRQRNKTDKYHDKEYERAKKQGDRDEIEKAMSLASHELHEIEDEILHLEYSYLMSIASKMLLPTPTSDKEGKLWEQSRYTGKWRLTSKGILELRGLIRKEKKEKTELLVRWISIIIGLIGAITGLVAVIKK